MRGSLVSFNAERFRQHLPVFAKCAILCGSHNHFKGISYDSPILDIYMPEKK